MTSAATANFKFIDRNAASTIVLIPGWASDHRIFEVLNLNFNYLVPMDFSPIDFERNLLNAVKEYGMSKVSLFGWSMGGFLASEFCSKHSSLVENLFLVSIRKKYIRTEIEEIKKYLNENKRGFLYKFYLQFFYKSENREHFNSLMKEYCRKLELKSLLDGLEYLQMSQIRPQIFEKINKIKIIHGEFDRIAPLDEALEIKKSLPKAEFVLIKDAGHVPFWETDLSEVIS